MFRGVCILKIYNNLFLPFITGWSIGVIAPISKIILHILIKAKCAFSILFLVSLRLNLFTHILQRILKYGKCSSSLLRFWEYTFIYIQHTFKWIIINQSSRNMFFYFTRHPSFIVLVEIIESENVGFIEIRLEEFRTLQNSIRAVHITTHFRLILNVLNSKWEIRHFLLEECIALFTTFNVLLDIIRMAFRTRHNKLIRVFI